MRSLLLLTSSSATAVAFYSIETNLVRDLHVSESLLRRLVAYAVVRSPYVQIGYRGCLLFHRNQPNPRFSCEWSITLRDTVDTDLNMTSSSSSHRRGVTVTVTSRVCSTHMASHAGGDLTTLQLVRALEHRLLSQTHSARFLF
jgi:hypothetical protein